MFIDNIASPERKSLKGWKLSMCVYKSYRRQQGRCNVIASKCVLEILLSKLGERILWKGPLSIFQLIKSQNSFVSRSALFSRETAVESAVRNLNEQKLALESQQKAFELDREDQERRWVEIRWPL